MVDISNIINISITRSANNVSQAGFGTPLIVGETTTSDLAAGEVSTYTGLSAMLDDGFVATDPEYLKASKYFAQSPRVQQVKVALRDTAVAMVQTLTFDGDLVTSSTVSGTVGGTAITPVAFTTNHNTTMTALAAAIQASSLVATATVTGPREITVTAQTAGLPCTLSSFVSTGGATNPTATIATTTANVGITEDLTAIDQNDPDFYFLDLVSTTQAVLELAAAWVETKRKLFGLRTADTDVLDSGSTTDIAATLLANSYSRTFVAYNETNTDYFDSAWTGTVAPYTVGKTKWTYQQPTGITGSNLTETEYANLIAKNANAYVRFGNDNYRTFPGVTSDGTKIENIRGEDWIYARLQERMLDRFSKVAALPFTISGLVEVESIVTGVMQDAENQGILSTDPENKFTVSVPALADIDPADKAAGILRGVEWSAVFAGSIDRVYFTGNLSS